MQSTPSYAAKKTSRKRRLPPSSNETKATKKTKQLQLEDLIPLVNHHVSNNSNNSNNNLSSITSVYAENSTPADPAPQPTSSSKLHPDLRCSERVDTRKEHTETSLLNHSKCEVAKYLSEICFISAETLILLLGHINNIEAQLKTIIQLVSTQYGKPPLAKQRLKQSSSDHTQTNERHSCPQGVQKVTRAYQPHQLVLNIPKLDAPLWHNKNKILETLSALLKCQIHPKDIKYYFYLPSSADFKRIFLSFGSKAVPKRLFHMASSLRATGLFPSRVFKDTSPKALFRYRNVSHPNLQCTKGSHLYLNPNMSEPNPTAQRDNLEILKDKLSDLLVSFRNHQTGNVLPSDIAPGNASEAELSIQSNVSALPSTPPSSALANPSLESGMMEFIPPELNQQTEPIESSENTLFQPPLYSMSSPMTVFSMHSALGHPPLPIVGTDPTTSEIALQDSETSLSDVLVLKVSAPTAGNAKTQDQDDIISTITDKKLTNPTPPSQEGTIHRIPHRIDSGATTSMRPGALFSNDPHFDKLMEVFFPEISEKAPLKMNSPNHTTLTEIQLSSPPIADPNLSPSIPNEQPLIASKEN